MRRSTRAMVSSATRFAPRFQRQGARGSRGAGGHHVVNERIVSRPQPAPRDPRRQRKAPATFWRRPELLRPPAKPCDARDRAAARANPGAPRDFPRQQLGLVEASPHWRIQCSGAGAIRSKRSSTAAPHQQSASGRPGLDATVFVQMNQIPAASPRKPVAVRCVKTRRPLRQSAQRPSNERKMVPEGRPATDAEILRAEGLRVAQAAPANRDARDFAQRLPADAQSPGKRGRKRHGGD